MIPTYDKLNKGESLFWDTIMIEIVNNTESELRSILWEKIFMRIKNELRFDLRTEISAKLFSISKLKK